MRSASSPSSPFVLGRRALGAVVLAALVAPAAVTSGVRADEAAPPFRIVVHPNNPARSAERAFLSDVFLKKHTRWNDGEAIRPVDLRPAHPARQKFTERVLKRSVGAVRSYWQQRIFSGRDVPPPELETDDEVLAFVAKYPGAIGYLSGTAKLKGVKELSIE
jgi:hypothetical protein